ncbi:hypothetical protein DL93DRAFT_2168931 [Clavulina sp. PMI_390]|nr:hypothetical protein DL93DRAFT_2168931 [Clavulina sp. PMI_390]
MSSDHLKRLEREIQSWPLERKKEWEEGNETRYGSVEHMKRVLNIVQEAEREGLSEQKMEAILNLASSHEYDVLNHAYGEGAIGDGGWDFFPIYSQNHIQDGSRLGMGRGGIQQLIEIMTRGGSRVDQQALMRLAGGTFAYDRNNVPSPHSTPLAFFQRLPTSLTAFDPRTTNLREARCEITTERASNPVQLVLGGGACAVQGVGGYKERDPTLSIWSTDPRTMGANGYKFRSHVNTGHIDIAFQLAIDGERHLVWTADETRIKSHHFDLPRLSELPDIQKAQDDDDEEDNDASFIARHTFDSDGTSVTFRGPIALVDNGAKLLRCGPQGVAIWDVDAAPTHGEDGNKILGEELDIEVLAEITSRDSDVFMDKVEASSGSPLTSQLDFDVSLGQVNITGWANDPSDQNKAMVVFTGDEQYSVFGLDLVTGKRRNRYLGHGACVSQISTLAQDSAVFLSSCYDGAARLYDVRMSTPVMTMSTTEEKLGSSVLVSSGAGLYAFVGGTRSQSVKLWDLRTQCAVYELSTGNNSVSGLGWDEEHQTLYAATECEALDRIGYHHDYRWAKAPSWEKDQWDGEEEEKGWPSRARHDEESFGVVFDAGQHCLFRYVFKDNADVSIIPEYGQGVPRRESGYGRFW